jgi:hypothetical protein
MTRRIIMKWLDLLANRDHAIDTLGDLIVEDRGKVTGERVLDGTTPNLIYYGGEFHAEKLEPLQL